MLRAFVAQATVEVFTVKKPTLNSRLSIALFLMVLAFVILLILALMGPRVGNEFPYTVCCGLTCAN